MNFSDWIFYLKSTKSFPLLPKALEQFNLLKKEIANASLSAIDDNPLFVVECDASEVALSATLNHGDRPAVFMSGALYRSETQYPSVEKNNVEAVRKWPHLLACQQFALIADKKSVAFMLDN